MRRIGIEIETERLRIEFPFDRSLVQTVKTLPQRRWDPDQKAWYVPFDHIERVFDTLLDHHFKISHQLRDYCRENHKPIDEIIDGDGEPSGPIPVPPGTLTVSELNLEAKAVLEEAFDESVWLVGEMQSYDRTKDWRHAFFELVERPSEDADPIAKIQAVMFQRDRERIETKLEGASDDIRLRDGLAIRAKGDVEIYPQSGSYQIVIRDVDPTFTTGKIQQNRQQILDRLEEKGIREKNRELAWPICPLRVGLITSHGSDAHEDFLNELESSGFGFDLTVHHAYVQGDRTEESVLRALEYFEDRAEDFDVVVIVRGGGARSDLAYFDTDAIGEAVCEHPLKVVCGIGHQRDVCLLDHICASQKTPTAAGRTLVERVDAFAARVDEAIEGILDGAERRVRDSRERLGRLSVELGHRVDRRLNHEERRLADLRSSLSHGARDRLEEERRRVEGAARSLPQLARSASRREKQRLHYVRRRLRPEALRRRFDRESKDLRQLRRRLERAVHARLEREDERLERLAERLRLLDPQQILDRGFSILWNDGEVVRKPDQAPAGEQLDVRLADGEIRVVVEDED